MISINPFERQILCPNCDIIKSCYILTLIVHKFNSYTAYFNKQFFLFSIKFNFVCLHFQIVWYNNVIQMKGVCAMFELNAKNIKDKYENVKTAADNTVDKMKDIRLCTAFDTGLEIKSQKKQNSGC